MGKGFRNITGTFDVLPDAYTSDGTRIESVAAWRFAERHIRDVMAHYRYHEIRTPIFEPTELVARGVGELTDIVSKEMFAFERGETHYVLRPELTAPVIRSYLQHHLDQRGGVQKLYYIGPCFRAERPQKGRFRQFHQFGVEVIGEPGARCDAESIALMMRIYHSFGLKDLNLRVNSLGDENSRPRYREALRDYFEPLKEQLGEDSRRRLDSNPLRILDTNIEAERRLLQGAPVIGDYVDEESAEHFEEVKECLRDLSIGFEVDPFLVRGLDYYTRTAFELESPRLGAQSALAGGGRYDLLAEEVGSSARVPAVGFAAGFERLFLALAGENVPLPGPEETEIYIVALGSAAQKWAFAAADAWRSQGLRVATDLRGRSMKAQMKEADRQGASTVVIVGDDEMERGEALVRDMGHGEQHPVPFDDLPDALR